MSSPTTEIVRIPFRDGEVLAVDVNGKPHVMLKPAFEAIGLDADRQIRNLRSRAWATTAVTAVVAGDGRTRDMVTADVRTFLMALATIPESRVNEAARPLLMAYQAEVADAIEAYWTRGVAAQFTRLQLLEMALASEKRTLELTAQAAIDGPKAVTYDHIVADKSWYRADEVAKSHFGHLKLGRNNLEKAMQGKFIFRIPCDGTRHPKIHCPRGHWSPYQPHVEAGLLAIKWEPGEGKAAKYEYPGLMFSLQGIEVVREYLASNR